MDQWTAKDRVRAEMMNLLEDVRMCISTRRDHDI